MPTLLHSFGFCSSSFRFISCGASPFSSLLLDCTGGQDAVHDASQVNPWTPTRCGPCVGLSASDTVSFEASYPEGGSQMLSRKSEKALAKLRHESRYAMLSVHPVASVHPSPAGASALCRWDAACNFMMPDD